MIKIHLNKNDSNVISGAYNNYIENRKLFIELGINIIDSLDECFSIFDISSKTVRKNVEILNQYGIDKENYVKSLSCLSGDSYRIASIKTIFHIKDFIPTKKLEKKAF